MGPMSHPTASARDETRIAIVSLLIVSPSRHKTNVFVQFKETIQSPIIPLDYNVPLAWFKVPFK